jgi:hypothetical protein
MISNLKRMDAIKYAEQIAYSSREVLRFTYDMAVKYKHSPGVYCECGVAAGAQIIAMAAGAPNKTIYAFDSFQGISLPSNKDDQYPGIRFLSKEEQAALPNPGEQVLESSGATAVSEDDFWGHLKSSGVIFTNVYAIKGWFEETLPLFADEMERGEPERISILRLDADLYNSTYVCLKYLYPKVIKGGLVIIDDWALPGCRDAVNDYFADLRARNINEPIKMQFIKDENSTVAYWVKL